MKRIAIKLVVFLLLGAVVNVAVAWTSVWWAPLPVIFSPVKSMTGRARQSTEYHGFVAQRLTRKGADRVSSWWMAPHVAVGEVRYPEAYAKQWVPTWASGVFPDSRYVEWGWHYRMVEARGWPLISLRSSHIRCVNWGGQVGSPRVLGSVERRESAWPLPDLASSLFVEHGSAGSYPWKAVQQLPLRPMWRNFAINAAFYAVILWLLWSTPFAARRLIRKRRGRCVRCGYDLRGTEHEVCPECGAKE